eukprot:8832309-Ditylum_brightwellii.AAC.1
MHAATKNSAAHALNKKEVMPKGVPQKTGVAQKGAKWECHTGFWRGRASTGIAQRQGNRNM